MVVVAVVAEELLAVPVAEAEIQVAGELEVAGLPEALGRERGTWRCRHT